MSGLNTVLLGLAILLLSKVSVALSTTQTKSVLDATPVSVTGCSFPTTCPTLRIREEWRSMTDCEQNRYINAVIKLKAATTGKNYDWFVNTHVKYSSAIHSTSWFLSWHRQYILDFENALRALGGIYKCMSLPFWDWTLDAGSIAEQHNSEVLLDLGGNVDNACLKAPFDSWINPATNKCVKRRVGSPSYGFTTISGAEYDVTTYNTYAAFNTNWQSYPHGIVHNFVGGNGGDMAMMSSPGDPVFFLHHCQVDRVWALQQECHNQKTIGSITFPTFSVTNPDTNKKVTVGTTTAFFGLASGSTSTVMNIVTLKYSYEPVSYNWATSEGKACVWKWFSSSPSFMETASSSLAEISSAAQVSQMSLRKKNRKCDADIDNAKENARSKRRSRRDAVKEGVEAECTCMLYNPNNFQEIPQSWWEMNGLASHCAAKYKNSKGKKQSRCRNHCQLRHDGVFEVVEAAYDALEEANAPGQATTSSEPVFDPDADINDNANRPMAGMENADTVTAINEPGAVAGAENVMMMM